MLSHQRDFRPSTLNQLDETTQTNKIDLTWNASKNDVEVVKYLIYRNEELIGSQKG